MKNLVIAIYLLLLYPCNREVHDHTIRLKWNKTFEGENWNYVQTGFLWNLSYLGAELPIGALKKMITMEPDSVHFKLDLNYAGFNKQSLENMEVILDSLKLSEEFKTRGCIDMGRFIMITQNSTWHYYKITGVEENLNVFKKKYKFSDADQYLVTSSGVTKENRLVSIHVGNRIDDIAFMAEVGEGDPQKGKFKPTEIEVFDVMKNGQLRFAIYDDKGRLKSSSNPKHSIAGKPSKCLWCHESSIQELYYGEYENEGYISASDFLCYVEKAMQVINEYRDSLSTEIDFKNTHQHTYSELNYTGFMNPTLQRVASEFEIDLDEARKMLVNIPVHEIKDFPFYYTSQPYFGTYKNLYNRDQIDKLLPYIATQVPQDALELSDTEPNYFGR